MPFTVTADTSVVQRRFGRDGTPQLVRRLLRAVIPDLTKRLGALVDSNLDHGLKTRRRLVVKKEMVENPKELYGRVTTVAIAPPALLPQWLEDGTAPHMIEARNASALFFFWEKMGKNVAFKSVHHPGFAGIHYTRNAFEAMEDEIKRAMTKAVLDASVKAKES